MKSGWNHMDKESRIAAITKLAKKGLSASQIANEIGDGASRNAVIGYAHRYKIKMGGGRLSSSFTAPANDVDRKVAKKVAKPKVATKEKTNVVRIKKTAKKQAEATDAGVCEVLEFKAPEYAPVSMMHLSGKTCRWPLNESYRGLHPREMMFCGRPALADHPYCSGCRAKSFGGFVSTRAPKEQQAPKKKERRPFIRWLR